MRCRDFATEATAPVFDSAGVTMPRYRRYSRARVREALLMIGYEHTAETHAGSEFTHKTLRRIVLPPDLILSREEVNRVARLAGTSQMAMSVMVGGLMSKD